VEISGIIQATVLGLGTGLALIVAIGAQNAFVLRQGLLGRHVAAVVIVCAVSDAALIAAGVAGMGGLVTAAPDVVVVLRYVGAAFLLCYGIMAARRAFRPQALVLEAVTPGGGVSGVPAAGAPGAPAAPRFKSLAAALATILALTWLNPHVYLDTVVLLGSVANAQESGLQWWFGAGAALGSIVWFCSLGFGARLLRGFFAKPASWRILDGCIAVIMTAFAAGLAFGA
jgi:L-lysine exporter family protein LysE/ArgO